MNAISDLANVPARADAPPRVALFTRTGWAVLVAALLVNCVLVPVAALVIPDDSPFAMSAYGLTLVGKIMCYALCAVALDLVWGYCGVLSLGHGLFFALGGYAMGMYLMRQIGREGVYQSDLPDFMVFLDWKAFPWFWQGSDSFLWMVAMVVLVPGVVAFVFGWFAFRSRVKGVYLSIITQALTYAAMLLFFRNDTGFGGNNGFTDFKRILGFPIAAIETRVTLFVITGLALAGALVACRAIVRSKLGRVVTAIRDAESRVMFTGYDPLPYKLFIWTFSAVLCGIAGALYVPQVGIINPSEMAPANSIEMVIWVAVGGRGTLIGPIIGAGIVNGAKSYFTAAFPEIWLFFLGALFVAATLFLPRGVVGLFPEAQAVTMTPSVRLDSGPTALASGVSGYGHPLREGEVDVSHKVILYLESVTVSFDGFRALNDLSLAIDDGELRCVIGPNGAGKTTMMDVITGRTRPDQGKVFFGQTIDLTRMSESAIAQSGIGRKFQKPTVFEHHTVWENLELALKGDRRWWRGLSWRTTLEEARRIDELLATIRLEDEATRPAGLLAHGQKQRLEIGILLAQEPRLLLLDEPVAGMTDEETERLADLLVTLEGRQSIVVVEHDMEFVRRIAKRVTVLHEGSVLAEGTLDEVKANDAVVEVYLGR